MNILNSQEIKDIIDKWAKVTQQRVIDNLKRRGLVAQLPIVNDVSYTITIQNDLISIEFLFSRAESKKLKVEKENGLKKLSVYDPLAGRYKEFLGFKKDTARLGFLRRTNVYELIQGKYADELTSNIISEIPEIAGNILITGL